MSEISKRLKELPDALDISTAAFERSISVSNGYLRNIKGTPSADKIERILILYPQVSRSWLLTGEGEMLKSADSHNISPQFEILDEPNSKKGLIPFYGDVQSTGGDVSLRADVDGGQIYPTSWIDAGDFFREATAIIEHVGESMVEYPNKCMIAIKKVDDMTLLVNGDVYVIETSEYRVTKKVLDNSEYITGYSTNPETYPDGQLVYAPMKIPKDKIRAMYTVLGYAYVRHGQKIVLRTKK